VIQSRMKGAGRVLDDLRAMYKERADIEAEYSKRLSKLAKQGFGKDDTGSMRAAIDVVRMEIDQTSKTHADLSTLIKKDLEGQMTEYQNKLMNQRKNSAAQIEKLFKQKQVQESYVNKSRDKYEQDCIKINGYTAQSSLVQGRDLDKVTNKLDKAQSTVSANDKDYQNFVRALKDTTFRWNSEWKAYLDQCQDLEEERLEFLKSNLWNYANAISAVCVADDESCERVRVALETCEAPKDIMDFIQRAGTGSAIADPPEYINYSKGQPPPPRPTFKTAKFQRSTTRQTSYLPTGPPPSVPMMPPVQPLANNGSSPSPSNRAASGIPAPNILIQPRRESVGAATFQNMQRGAPGDDDSVPRPPPSGAVMIPDMASSATIPTGPSAAAPVQDNGMNVPAVNNQAPRPERRMSARNFIARTPSMNKSARGNPPAASQVVPSETASTVSTAYTTIDHQEDPIAKALANLRMRPGGRSPGPQSPARSGPSPNMNDGRGARSSQYGSVGPSFGQEPRAPSPSAAFMQEPAERSTSPLPVEEVLGQYGQSFPGERRALSRQNSTASRNSRMSFQPPIDRAKSPGPVTDGGFAGVGARGRSPSPQPFHRGHQSSLSQPQVQQQPQRQQQPQQQRPVSQYAQQQPNRQGAGTPQSRPTKNAISMQQAPPRSTTPLGIALDASGSVTHDQMADEYIRRTGSVGPGQMGPSASQPAVQRIQSQYGPTPGSGAASPVRGPGYAPSIQPQQSYASMSNQYSQQQQQQQVPPPNAQHGYQQQPYPQSQTPVQQLPPTQDSVSSLHRDGFGGYTSPYNRTPAAAAPSPAPQPMMAHAPSPAPVHAQAYGQQAPPPQMQQPQHQQYAQPPQTYQPPLQQETPASSYMQQYQRQQQQQQQPPPASSTPAPGPPLQQANSYHQSMQQPQLQQAARYQPPANNIPYANQGQYQAQPQAQQQQPVMQHQVPPSRSNAQAAPPTGQFSDTGKPILFYVKALYDYNATTDEEFSFTAGDVIAVWETNPDGWWLGELLDDARRRGGANTFPSNFVSLLS
jgi:hypothetical protein